MKAAHVVLVSSLLTAGAVSHGQPATPPARDWSAVDKALGAVGKDLPGGVHRYGWPRGDVKVSVGSGASAVTVEPALALGAWAAFLDDGGAEAMVMGDLALLDAEVTPVVTALVANRLEVTALHNHLLNETPHVAYLHFSGHGDGVSLARGL